MREKELQRVCDPPRQTYREKQRDTDRETQDHEGQRDTEKQRIQTERAERHREAEIPKEDE